MIVACDTFRSGAIEQLRTHAERLGVPLFQQGFFVFFFFFYLFLYFEIIKVMEEILQTLLEWPFQQQQEKVVFKN
jgi:hypothetical protein